MNDVQRHLKPDKLHLSALSKITGSVKVRGTEIRAIEWSKALNINHLALTGKGSNITLSYTEIMALPSNQKL